MLAIRYTYAFLISVVVMQEALAKSNEKILEKIVEMLDSENQGVQQNCVALLALLARIEGSSFYSNMNTASPCTRPVLTIMFFIEGHKRILETDFKRRLLALLQTNNVEMRQLAEVCLRLLSNVADESF